jgi:uncharacterized membrane-anchored protein
MDESAFVSEDAPRVPNPEELFQEIRDTAFRLFEARTASGIDGDEITDWFDAETQVRAKYGL